ncbi:MAG TPA: serine/threonine protein phosphatase [Treponema sp.]|nr:serine/threonine protein phosphatase [Treponema sp.]
MFSSDAVAYIPLFGVAIVCAALFVLLGIIKTRKTAKVTSLIFLSLLVLITGCVYTALHPGMMRFVLLLLLASVIVLPYVIMLAFGKPKEEQSYIPVTEEIKKPEVVIEDIKPDQVSLLEKGAEFNTLAANGFGKKDGLQTLLDTINKTCVEVAKADGGAILMVDDFEDSINVKSFTGDFPPPYELPAEMPHKPLRVSTSFKFASFPLRDNIFGEIASSGKAEIINDPKSDSRIFENGPEPFLKLGRFIFVPIHLKGKGTVIGLIALSRNPDNGEFTQKEFDWILTLTDFAESALKSMTSFQEYKEKQELTKESDIATGLQNLLLPKKLPPLQKVQFGAMTEHTEGVCSDTYDVIPARSDRISFVLMDVAGKGTNSVLVMSMIRAMFRLVVNTTQSAGTILSWANRGICGEINFEHFASASLINYNPVAKQIQFATAGTTPVLLYSAAKGNIERKSISCEPIGVEKTTTYKDIQFTVSPGDIIITYSDGVVEALNAEGKQYSLERLSNLIKTNSKMSGKDIAALVKTDIKKFIGSEALHDDQTLLVLKIQ